ncbi:MAG: hypothetical protein PHI23_04370 [Candidatus Peribacteraceae bacterium]|nr:hypothetical protein [Candidatus Peribacteraceae bacterium]
MFQIFLDFLFPRRSLTGEEGEWITEEERRLLRPMLVIEERPELRSRGLHFLDRVVAGSAYRGSPLLKKAIHTFKYGRVPGLATDLAQFIVRAGSYPLSETPVLCPVPLHWARRFLRGFNQAEILARIVAREKKLPLENLLRRVRPTGFQSHRDREERFLAVKDAFRAIKVPLPPYVILIDDLSTTGATLDMCAKALKEAGVQRVDGWVVAHG